MIINNIVDEDYEVILDEKGYNTFTTNKLLGELRVIKFIVPGGYSSSPFKVKMFIDDIKIMDENITISDFYVLKIQPRDGSNQFFSMSNEFYTLNDNIRVEISGVPDNSLFITFRMKEV